jgi:hypothetical protein
VSAGAPCAMRPYESVPGDRRASECSGSAVGGTAHRAGIVEARVHRRRGRRVGSTGSSVDVLLLAVKIAFRHRTLARCRIIPSEE